MIYLNFGAIIRNFFVNFYYVKNKSIAIKVLHGKKILKVRITRYFIQYIDYSFDILFIYIDYSFDAHMNVFKIDEYI